MSSTFYRKYRPARFADIIGQEAVVKTIENSLLYDRVAHAYISTGPRGTGKTTLARLFAQAVNCMKRKGAEPCGQCLPCTLQNEGRSLDIIEIDAASHTGVDNIRELKETVALAPTVGSYEVYIIDEAHMLSPGAWNALLKTLEEPPAHVIFILATTRIDKVPETILSRALRFDLTRFPLGHIVKKLERIAKAEKIKIEKDALLIIARAAQGGMRDAEVIFTQIATLEESPIDAKRVALLLGVTETSAIATLLGSIAAQDLSGGLNHLRSLKNAGTNLSQLTLAILDTLRHTLFFSLDEKGAQKLVTDLTNEDKEVFSLLGQKLGSERIVTCLERFQEAYAQMKDTPIPELPLEIALAKLITIPRESSSKPTDSAGSRPTAEGEPKKEKRESKLLPSAKLTKVESSPSNTSPPLDFDAIRERWLSIVELAKNLNASVAVALSATTPKTAENNILILQVKYPFHKERLEDKVNRLTLDKAFDTILGFRPRWRVQVESAQKSEESSASSPLIDQALDILGGKLVSES